MEAWILIALFKSEEENNQMMQNIVVECFLIEEGVWLMRGSGVGRRRG